MISLPALLLSSALAFQGGPLEAGSLRAQGDTLLFLRPHLTVAVEARALPLGTAQDPEGREGAAWITSEVLRERIRRAVSPRPHALEVELTPWFTIVTVRVPPNGLDAASRAVQDAIRGPAPEAWEVEAARQRALAQLRFRDGSPMESFRLEVDRMLLGVGSAAARPSQGTRLSLPSVGVEDVARLWAPLSHPLLPPFHLTSPGGPERTEPINAPRAVTLEVRDPASPWGGLRVGVAAWSQGDRLRISREITNGWVAVAYPVPQELPREAVDALLGVLREQLTPSPPDPSLYGLEVEVRITPRGRILLFTATVAPGGLESWEERIVSAVSRLAAGEVPDAFLTLHLRRYRTRAVLDETPGGWLQGQLLEALRTGSVSPPSPPPLPSQLPGWASGLGPPRILLYGPELR